MAVYNTTADGTLITADATTGFSADSDPYVLPSPVTNSADDYMTRITPWQANPVKARFLATVRAGVQPYADAQAFVANLPKAFDVDEAIGAQLDVDGLWIGRDRYVPIPLPDTTFALDIAGRGLEEGYWQGPYDSANAISSLPDNFYRRLLYAKILANRWDGTAPMAVAIVRAYLTDPATQIFVNDGARAVVPQPSDAILSLDVFGCGLDEGRWLGAMEYSSYPERMGIAYSVCIAGKLPSRTDLYILANDLLPVRGMGADVEIAVATIDGAPLFGLDMDTAQIGGLDIGAWGTDPATVAATLNA